METKEKKQPQKGHKPKKSNKRLVVVRVRGTINLSYDLKRTFEMLNLHNKNGCVIVADNASNRGMINKVKDYVTWGELYEDLYKELMEKKADLYNNRLEDKNLKIKYNKHITYNKKNYKKFIRLIPPTKGYGKKGIKSHFKKNGALGYRGDKINDLIKRMM